MILARYRFAAAALAFACAVALPRTDLSAQSAPIDRALRVFLDCDDCDDDYVRNETRWAEFVRDRTVADVHVLITDLDTGAGGDEYTLVFVGRALPARTDTLRLVTAPTATSAENRDRLTRMIHLGLAPFAARTPAAARLRLSFPDADDDTRVERAAPTNDPWKAWVFEFGIDGSLEREQRQRTAEIGGSFEATRVTAGWKAGVELEGERRSSRFALEDRTVTSSRESFSIDAIVVRSVGLRWGTGAQISLSSSTFENTRRVVRGGPAVEFSVWPYAQATQRQLTLQYAVGMSAFTYREETIFSRFNETRPTHSILAAYDVTQNWGSAEATFLYTNYIDNPTQHRLEFDASVNVRLVRGLELELGARASQIRDQLSIAKRDATDDEILLELRDLQTNFLVDASIGLNFTFGSIFNSVVNPRFGGGPGQLLR